MRLGGYGGSPLRPICILLYLQLERMTLECLPEDGHEVQQ